MYVDSSLANARIDVEPDTCIGYNTLFVVPDVPRKEMDNGEDLPDGKRIWNWLILTDDGICFFLILYPTFAESCRDYHLDAGEPTAHAARAVIDEPRKDSRCRAQEYQVHLLRRLEATPERIGERFAGDDPGAPFQQQRTGRGQYQAGRRPQPTLLLHF